MRVPPPYDAGVTAAASNTPEYSVSELAGALKKTVETTYGLVRVRGEISGWKRAASGHCYLCLKDDGAVIDGVMWKATAGALPFRPEDGLEVVVTGKLTTYPGRSKYQIVIDRMEPAGVGALLAQVEERKRRLAAEGLFDADRKRALPFIPQVIGVVTSPTGAVIRDILHRLAERFPRRVLVWPVQVQGDGAAAQIVAALQGFDAIASGGPVPRPDLVILARGGGSIEDLAAFNEESVVRAVAALTIPIITAVGHETDTTLVDFAGDHRAPTPTAAAERAVPVRADLLDTVRGLALRGDRAARKGLLDRRDRAAAQRLPRPATLLALRQQKFDELAGRLPTALRQASDRWRERYERRGGALRLALLERRLARAREALAHHDRCLHAGWRTRAAHAGQLLTASAARLRPRLVAATRDRDAARLDAAARLLDTLGPLQVMKRGYALVRAPDGTPVTSAAAAAALPALTLGFHDGEVPVSTALPRQGRLF